MSSDEAISEMRRLARELGILVGPSSGANLVVARRVRAELESDAIVVTVFADEGEKHLSEYFSPDSIDVTTG